MLNKSELDLLLSKYQTAEVQASYAYVNLQYAIEEHQKAREKMNLEHANMEKHVAHYNTIWNAYHRLRDHNIHLIEVLRYKVERGQETNLDSVNAEIDRLFQEINAAKEDAKQRAPKTVKVASHQAEYCFDGAKVRHEIAEAQYLRLASLCERCKAEYEQAKAEYDRAKQAKAKQAKTTAKAGQNKAKQPQPTHE